MQATTPIVGKELEETYDPAMTSYSWHDDDVTFQLCTEKDWLVDSTAYAEVWPILAAHLRHNLWQ